MKVFFISRILWLIAGAAAVAVCVVHFIPFTYQQVVRAALFPQLNALTGYLPLVITLASALVGVSYILQIGRRDSKPVHPALFVLVFLVPALAAILDVLGLPANTYSWWLALGSAIVMATPAAADLQGAWNGGFARSFQPAEARDKDYQLLISLLLTGLAGVAVAVTIDLQHWAECLLAVLMVTMIAYAFLAFIFRVAERARDPLRIEWAFMGVVIGVFGYHLFTAGVFPALAYVGPAQKILSAVMAEALVVTAMGLAQAEFGSGRLHSVTGLRLLLAPLAFMPSRRMVSLTAVFAVLGAEVWLIKYVGRMDWDFLGQKTIFLAGSLLVFANLQWALPLRSPAWFRSIYPIMAGLAVLLLFVTFKSDVVNVDSKNNIVLAMAKSVLIADEQAFDEDHYRYLQESSNIPKTIHIEPAVVNLVGGDVRAPASLAPTAKHKYNVVMIVVDSLRPDYLTPYNPSSAVTPAIDAFAQDAIVFRKAFSRYGATGLSEPSIWVGGMIVHQQYVTPFYPMNSLQKMLDTDGYRIFASMDSILSQITKSEPNLTDLDPGISTQDLDLCVTLPKIRQQMQAGREQGPVFAYTQPQNIHISVLNRRGPASSYDSRFPGFYGPYAEELNHLDRCFGRFISGLKADGMYDDTIVVLTADHGDSLGEEGRFGHAYTVFPEVVRIPLIIHLPKALRDEFEWDPAQLAFTVDITPSLYTLMGHNVSNPTWMFGRPLFSLKGAPRPSMPHGPYLLASSYGAVYGLLDEEGSNLYISDGVNFVDYDFDLRLNPPRPKPISLDERARNEQMIRSRIADINNFYGFKGAHERN
jgi:hypothetical protein